MLLSKHQEADEISLARQEDSRSEEVIGFFLTPVYR